MNTQTENFETGTEIISLGITEQAIMELRIKYKEVPDVTTKEGYDQAKTNVGKLRKCWVNVGKESKIQKESALKHQRAVTALEKDIDAQLKEIAKPHMDAIKDIDEAEQRRKDEAIRIEQERINKIEVKINSIRQLGVITGVMTAVQLKLRLAEITDYVIDGSFEEFQEQATGVLYTSRNTMAAALAERQVIEDQQIENNRVANELREEQAENNRLDKIKSSIHDMKVIPVDMMGKATNEIKSKLASLEGLTANQDYYGEYIAEYIEALADTKFKLVGMINQQKNLDAQQKEIDNNQRKLKEGQAVQKQIDDKKAAEKQAKDTEVEMAQRLPEDQKLRGYADILASIELPNIKNMQLCAVLRESLLKVSEIKNYIYENTQSDK